MSDLSTETERLRKEAEAKLAEAARLERLQQEFPDLKRYVGRWNKVAYYSASVNERCDKYDIRHNCGCCNDSPLELWPYVETPFGNVYSDPPKFVVGERHWLSGDRPEKGWREKLLAAKIPQAIVDAVSYRFKSDAEERKQLAEDDDEYDPEEGI